MRLQKPKVVQDQKDRDNHHVSVEDKYGNAFVNELLPAFRIIIPRPRQIITLVSFDERELEVVEDPVSEVGTQMNSVVKCQGTRKHHNRVAKVVSLLPFEKLRPVKAAEFWHTKKECKGDSGGEK